MYELCNNEIKKKYRYSCLTNLRNPIVNIKKKKNNNFLIKN